MSRRTFLYSFFFFLFKIVVWQFSYRSKLNGRSLNKFLLIIGEIQGRIQDFKLEGRTYKNSAERREARKVLGYFVWKITILRQKIHIFSNCGGRREIFLDIFRVTNCVLISFSRYIESKYSVILFHLNLIKHNFN